MATPPGVGQNDRAMHRRLRGIAATLGLAFASDVAALDPHTPPSRLQRTVFGAEQGLAQGSVEVLALDHDGSLLVGTQEGLARFDGARFDPIPLPAEGSHVLSILVRRKGPPLVGTVDGLWSLDPEPRLLAKLAVAALAEGPGGEILVGTKSELFRLDAGGLVPLRRPDGTPILDSAAFRATARGVWFGSGSRLHFWNGHSFEMLGPDEGFPGAAQSLTTDDGDGILAATSRGLVRCASGRCAPFASGLPAGLLGPTHRDVNGILYVGSYDGWLARILPEGRVERIDLSHEIGGVGIRSLLEDPHGQLFVGSNGAGLVRLRPAPVETLSTEEGLPDRFVGTVLGTADGALWAGTPRGLARIEGDRVRRFDERDGLPSPSIVSLAETSSGDLLVGTAAGLALLGRGEDRFRRVPGGPEGLPVFAILEEEPGSLLVSSVAGLDRFAGGTWHRLAEAIDSRYLLGILRLPAGESIGPLFGGGLVRILADRVEPLPSPPSTTRAIQLSTGPGEAIWIAVENGGLVRRRDGRFTPVGTAAGLPTPTVYARLGGDDGISWLTTSRGIVRISDRDLDAAADGTGLPVPMRLLGRDDGMRSVECNGGSMPSIARLANGKIAVPTTDGVALVHPERVADEPVPPARIDEVIADGKRLPMSPAGLSLPAGVHRVEIRYTAPDLQRPERLRFRYRLDPLDDSWTDAGSRRIAIITYPRAGDLRFRVEALDERRIAGEAAILPLAVAPRFRETPAFWLLIIALVVVAFATAHQLRTLRERARRRELEALVATRTAELSQATAALADANRNLEQRVADGIAALATAERDAAYGRLVAGVAHEVRPPIFAVQTAAYLLRQSVGDDPRAATELATLDQETKRMSRMMDDLLDFARPARLQREPTDARGPLDEAAAVFRSEYPDAPFRLEVAPPDGDDAARPVLDIDRHRIVQVLVNLLGNARKHATGATVVRLSARREGSTVRFEVEDDGRGIEPERIDTVFEPFVGTGAGTGLGLAIVRRTVEEHGGRIAVESRPGRTLFTITLPVRPEESPEESP